MSRNISRTFWVLALAVFLVLPWLVGTYWLDLVILSMIFAIVVFSLNLLNGLTGMLSFGQAAFVGIGAYMMGILSVNGIHPFIAGIAAVVVAILAGVLIALPAARLKKHYLAICTLGFGVLISQLISNLEITRGPMGLSGIPTGGIGRVDWYYIIFVTIIILVITLRYIGKRSILGNLLKTVKADEFASASCGINVYAVKVFSFGLSAGLAGLAGVLYAAYLQFLTPDLFVTSESFQFLMMSVIGGTDSFAGGLIASLIFTILPEALRVFGESNFRLIIYGVTVLLVLLFMPTGIGGFFENPKGRWFARIRSRTEVNSNDSKNRG